MSSERIFRIYNWMTGTPDIRMPSSKVEFCQRVPWSAAITLGVWLPIGVVVAMWQFGARRSMVIGFGIFAVVMFLFTVGYVIFMRRQRAIVTFDLATGALTIPRMGLTLDVREIDRFQALEGYSIGGKDDSSSVPVVGLVYSDTKTGGKESVIYATPQLPEFHEAWTSFVEAVRATRRYTGEPLQPQTTP